MEEFTAIKVYIKTNAKNEITAINSELFITDFTGWIEIDAGFGDKYTHAQNNYLDKSILDEYGNYNYIYINKKILDNPHPNAETIANLNQQINELKQQLAETDYQAIKYAEGELSAEEYAPMKSQRAGWRVEINQLQQQLEEIGG